MLHPYQFYCYLLPPGDPIPLDASDDAGDGETGGKDQEHAAHVLHAQLGSLLLLRLLKHIWKANMKTKSMFWEKLFGNIE